MVGHLLSLRQITEDDTEFLLRVYRSTRQAELAHFTWTERESAAFLEQQFTAQHAYYQAQYPDAGFYLIELEGQPIGRLYVHHGPNEIRIIDIALLPEFRNQGFGRHLLRLILTEGEATDKTVVIHVERSNPALRLYSRLGFQVAGDDGLFLLMERQPGSPIA